MACFLSWSDWLILKESNARKRAVRTAKNKTGPRLPGSYAVCPSTDVVAVNQANDGGEIGGSVTESKKTIRNPDYSFDSWIKKAQKLGDQVKKIIDDHKKQDDLIDKKKKDIEKETKPKETKPKETKPKETKPKETKPKETKPKETKPDQKNKIPKR